MTEREAIEVFDGKRAILLVGALPGRIFDLIQCFRGELWRRDAVRYRFPR